MLGTAGCIFGFVVVKLDCRYDLDHAERLLSHHRASELLAGNVRFDEHPVAEGPVRTRQFLRWMRVILAHNEYADAGAFCHWLDHIRWRQQMPLRHLLARYNHPARYRNAGSLEHCLGGFLPHRQRGCKHARMRVGNVENFEHALQRAVLTGATMQQIERDLGLEFAQRRGNIAIYVDPADAVSRTLERIGASLA